MCFGFGRQKPKVFKCFGVSDFKNLRSFNVFEPRVKKNKKQIMFSSHEPQKPKVFICFRASNLRNLKSLHVFGPRTSTTSGFYMCWGLGRQQPKVFRYLDIDISSSVSRHRYLDICISTSVSQHRSGPLH